MVWLHNGSEVTYNGPRTGVSLIIDKSEVYMFVGQVSEQQINIVFFLTIQGDNSEPSAAEGQTSRFRKLYLLVSPNTKTKIQIKTLAGHKDKKRARPQDSGNYTCWLVSNKHKDTKTKYTHQKHLLVSSNNASNKHKKKNTN